MSEKITTVSIPKPLAEKIKAKIENTGFNSISSYVTYVLRQLISGSDQKENKEAFSKEDEENIKKRLRGLGYMP